MRLGDHPTTYVCCGGLTGYACTALLLLLVALPVAASAPVPAEETTPTPTVLVLAATPPEEEAGPVTGGTPAAVAEPATPGRVVAAEAGPDPPVQSTPPPAPAGEP